MLVNTSPEGYSSKYQQLTEQAPKLKLPTTSKYALELWRHYGINRIGTVFDYLQPLINFDNLMKMTFVHKNIGNNEFYSVINILH